MVLSNVVGDDVPAICLLTIISSLLSPVKELSEEEAQLALII